MWQPDCCHTSYMKNACPRETAAVRTCGPWGWRMAGTLKKRHGDGRFGTLVWMVFRFACLLRWLRSIRRAQPCDSVGSPDSCPLTSGYYTLGAVMAILGGNVLLVLVSRSMGEFSIYQKATLILGVMGLIAFWIMFFNMGNVYMPVLERLSVYPLVIWSFLTGVYLIKN